jgi:hypothetical protein
MDKLREREDAEIRGGGFGRGELRELYDDEEKYEADECMAGEGMSGEGVGGRKMIEMGGNDLSAKNITVETFEVCQLLKVMTHIRIVIIRYADYVTFLSINRLEMPYRYVARMQHDFMVHTRNIQ